MSDPAQATQRLRDEISDLNSSLRAVEFVLVDAGYLDPTVQLTGAVVPRPGIRIRGQLSVRGQQKAVELFSRLDEDGDQLVTYEDFRGKLRDITLPSSNCERTLAMKALKLPYGFLDRNELNRWYAVLFIGAKLKFLSQRVLANVFSRRRCTDAC